MLLTVFWLHEGFGGLIKTTKPIYV